MDYDYAVRLAIILEAIDRRVQKRRAGSNRSPLNSEGKNPPPQHLEVVRPSSFHSPSQSK